jgi:type II secretory pathway predicted ATPase ExeA
VASHTPKPFLFRDFRNAARMLLAGYRKRHYYMAIIGPSGSGKTALVRYLQSKLDRKAFRLLYYSHRQASAPTLLTTMANFCEVPSWYSRADRAQLIQTTLTKLSMRLIVCMDEAHSMTNSALEELRLLAEVALDKPPLFQVLLCGQPSLDERLRSPELFALGRRIQTKVQLFGLQHEELIAFLTHVLGKTATERFSSEALSVIFEKAAGMPGLVTHYCEQCLGRMPARRTLTKQIIIELTDSF